MTCVVRVCKNGLQFPASNPAIEGMKVLMTRCSCIAALFLIAGCSYWGRRPVDELKPIDPDAPIWIWTKSGVEQWHWVEITQDSVSGIRGNCRSPRGTRARCVVVAFPGPKWTP